MKKEKGELNNIKGITNYEMKEKFDEIETILKDIKKKKESKKESNFDISLFIIMAIIASVGILFYALYNITTYAFFIIIAIISMIILTIKMYISKNKNNN